MSESSIEISSIVTESRRAGADPFGIGTNANRAAIAERDLTYSFHSRVWHSLETSRRSGTSASASFDRRLNSETVQVYAFGSLRKVCASLHSSTGSEMRLQSTNEIV